MSDRIIAKGRYSMQGNLLLDHDDGGYTNHYYVLDGGTETGIIIVASGHSNDNNSHKQRITRGDTEFPTLREAIFAYEDAANPKPERRQMRTLEEIRRTPVGLLSDEEIAQLDTRGQEFARMYKARKAREDACPGHERIETATREQANRGNHRGECKHCGRDMSYDSGD